MIGFVAGVCMTASIGLPLFFARSTDNQITERHLRRVETVLNLGDADPETIAKVTFTIDAVKQLGDF